MPAIQLNFKPDCFDEYEEAEVWMAFVVKGEEKPYAYAGAYIHGDVFRIYWKIQNGFTIAQAKDLKKNVVPQMRKFAETAGCKTSRVITTVSEDVDFMKMVKFMGYSKFRLIAEQDV